MCNAACIDEAIKSRPCRNMYLLRVDRYFRDSFIESELIFDVVNDLSRVLSVSRSMLNRVPSGFFHFFLPRATLESLLYFPGFQGYSNNLVPQIRTVAKRDNMLSLSPLANQVKSFPEIFSILQIAFLRKEKNCCKSGYRKMWCRS